MKIEKYIKKKSDCYELVLDDNSRVLLHEDLILKYELLLKKEIDKDTLSLLLSKQNNYIAYDKALRFIGRKMRSCFEVKDYLEKLLVQESVIDDIIKRLNNQGYLNDKEYCKLYIKDRIALSNDGPNKIINYLRQNNIGSNTIDEFIDIFNKDIQYEKINKMISKYQRANSSSSNYALKQKILNNLINLGYDRSDILYCLNGFSFNEESIYKKEYDKIHDKLSKKYSGKELEYMIKQKLYQKGFRNY